MLRLGLGALGLLHVGVHMGDDLVRLHIGALVDKDVADPAGGLGRHVDLDRLDPAVAADNALGKRWRAQQSPAEERDDDHCRDDPAAHEPLSADGLHRAGSLRV